VATDLLRFQARYYQLEPSRTPGGKAIFARLSDSARVREHYQEVLAEVALLSDVEQRYDSDRRSQANDVLQSVLYVVAVVGVVQTLIAFWTMAAPRPPDFLFWLLAGGLAGLAVVLYWVAVRTRRRDKQRNVH
jgi:hypothetical protein